MSTPTILERLQTDITIAMKARDADTLSTLRMLKTALMDVKTRKAKDATLDPAEEIEVLQRYVKKRREVIEEMQKLGRPDVVAKEEQEIAVTPRAGARGEFPHRGRGAQGSRQGDRRRDGAGQGPRGGRHGVAPREGGAGIGVGLAQRRSAGPTLVREPQPGFDHTRATPRGLPPSCPPECRSRCPAPRAASRFPVAPVSLSARRPPQPSHRAAARPPPGGTRPR